MVTETDLLAVLSLMGFRGFHEPLKSYLQECEAEDRVCFSHAAPPPVRIPAAPLYLLSGSQTSESNSAARGPRRGNQGGGLLCGCWGDGEGGGLLCGCWDGCGDRGESLLCGCWDEHGDHGRVSLLGGDYGGCGDRIIMEEALSV